LKNIKHFGQDPLDGSWSQRFCNIYHEKLESGALSQCEHRKKCIALRGALERDCTTSIQATKEILFQGIPEALESLSLPKLPCITATPSGVTATPSRKDPGALSREE